MLTDFRTLGARRSEKGSVLSRGGFECLVGPGCAQLYFPRGVTRRGEPVGAQSDSIRIFRRGGKTKSSKVEPVTHWRSLRRFSFHTAWLGEPGE